MLNPSTIVRHFRRSPGFYVGKIGGRTGKRLYRFLDSRGGLSEFLGDPITIVFRALPTWLTPVSTSDCLVSVIVATKDNADTLEQSLNSLFAQTHKNLEIIVINDGSIDRTQAILENFARAEPRLRIICNEHSIGTGASRNLGLRVATGEFVTFHDGDDISVPTRISIQLHHITKRHAKLCLCNYVRTNADGISLDINHMRVKKCIISMMFPRDAVLSKVGYFQPGSLSEDSDYYERIKIAFGSSSEIVVFRTLYRALFRPNSSFFANVTILESSDQAVEYTETDYASTINRAMRDRHNLMREGSIPVYLGYNSLSEADAETVLTNVR